MHKAHQQCFLAQHQCVEQVLWPLLDRYFKARLRNPIAHGRRQWADWQRTERQRRRRVHVCHDAVDVRVHRPDQATKVKVGHALKETLETRSTCQTDDRRVHATQLGLQVATRLFVRRRTSHIERGLAKERYT